MATKSQEPRRPHLTTFLYALAAWFIFNIIFAAAMYFRPTRKKQGSGSITGSRRTPRTSHDIRQVVILRLLVERPASFRLSSAGTLPRPALNRRVPPASENRLARRSARPPARRTQLFPTSRTNGSGRDARQRSDQKRRDSRRGHQGRPWKRTELDCRSAGAQDNDRGCDGGAREHGRRREASRARLLTTRSTPSSAGTRQRPQAAAPTSVDAG